MKGHLFRALLGVCGMVLVGCTASAGTSSAPSSASAAGASPSRVAAAPQSESEQSYQAELAAASAQVAAQVRTLDPDQLSALATKWALAPISGDPLHIAQLEWAESYFAALKRAQPAIQSYQAEQAAQLATEQHCFDLAHTLIHGSDQASAQAADHVRIACDSEFGVP